jgi:hypothetical protein
MMISDECTHENEVICVRTCSNGSLQYVRQCVVCGHASNAIAKSTLALEDIASLPVFDDLLADRYWEQRQARSQAQRTSEKNELDAAYEVYLDGPEWWALRELVMHRAHNFCEGCGRRPAKIVHHLTYEHRYHAFLFELVALCRDCHDRVHNRGRYAPQDESLGRPT